MRFLRLFVFPGLIIVFLFYSCKEEKKTDDPVSFEWSNVLVGGGGYVTGLKIHPLNPDLWYIRTDVGSAYRWSGSRQKLLPITDWISIQNANLYGVNGIALDPDDENIVFIAAGRYIFADPSDVLMSADKGKSWEFTGLNKPFGANEMPAKLGDKIVINPHNTNYLWCGTVGAGLWVYDRINQTWQKNKAIDAEENIQTIVFHPVDSSILFLASIKGKIFRSTDEGKSFQLLLSLEGEIANMDISAGGNYLYCATMDSGLKLLGDPASSNAWKDISPLVDGEYRCVATDPFYEQGVAVIPKMMNGLRKGLYYSSNTGESWTRKEVIVEQVIPWHGENYPGAAASSIIFHPEDRDVVYITDWYSVYKTQNFRADTSFWNNKISTGHEELVCLNLATPPENQKNISLYSAHADVGGFGHKDVNEYPDIVFRDGDQQTLKNTTGLAFCEKQPETLYRIGAVDHDGDQSYFARSNDFGLNWEIQPGYRSEWKWGRVAVSAKDPGRVVVATVDGGILYTNDGGRTFEKSRFDGSTGLRGPVFRYAYPLTSDKVNGGTFYFYSWDDSSFHRSLDFGETWTRIDTNLPAPERSYYSHQLDKDYYSLISIPENEGHLFLALADEGLFFTTDGGESWSKIEQIIEAPLVAAGKAFPGKDYPAVYVLAKMKEDEALWYYVSLDQGDTWKRINDESVRIGNNPEIMAADRQVHGKVYVGTNGSGIAVGNILP